MRRKLITLLILCILCVASYGTYCAFSKTEEKTGKIITKDLSKTFLSDEELLTKVQVLDNEITSINKEEFIKVNTVPEVSLDEQNIVSTASSSVPIYLWIENNNIYYFTIGQIIN